MLLGMKLHQNTLRNCFHKAGFNITSGELTNDDVVAHLQGQSHTIEDGSDVDDREVVAPEVTLGEAQMCIKKLRYYFQAQEETTSFLANIDALENYLDKQRGTMRQCKVTDF